MPSKKLSYREANAQLDAVLLKLEDPAVSVDEALAAYEEGLQLIETLQDQLSSAENRITQLRERFGDKVE